MRMVTAGEDCRVWWFGAEVQFPERRIHTADGGFLVLLKVVVHETEYEGRLNFLESRTMSAMETSNAAEPRKGRRE